MLLQYSFTKKRPQNATDKGDYKQNNITLGDLQKSTINILNVVMQSNQFANLFDDVESSSYTQDRADQLEVFYTVEKTEVK